MLALRVSLSWMRHTGQDWSVASDPYFLNCRNLRPFDVDLFAYHSRVFPFTQILVLIGIFRIEFFDIQVFNVGDSIGKPPGNMLVMSYDDAGSAGETCPDHIEIA